MSLGHMLIKFILKKKNLALVYLLIYSIIVLPINKKKDSTDKL